MNTLLVDSHCHLDFPDYDGRMEDIRERMKASGVGQALCISINLADFPKVLRLAHTYENFFASVGVHPDQDPSVPGSATSVEQLVSLASDEKVIAIGETGLDYHWHKDAPEWQRERFRTHIRAALECRKPLVVHTREAPSDTLAIMREEGAASAGGVMHCFTETLEMAKAAIDLNFYISFSGIVTFKNAVAIQDVARQIPLERLLVETDSPFLTPVPHRGKGNEPAFTRHVAEHIARLRGISMEQVIHSTTSNFQRLFFQSRMGS